MMENNYEDIIPIYGIAFPQNANVGSVDTGYILPNGRIIDLNIDGEQQCHGGEFLRKIELAEWRASHPELCWHIRQVADEVMSAVGGIEFTISRMDLRSVRLPRKPLTAAQRGPLREIISRILENGFIRIEILSTREHAEYDAAKNSVDAILNKIDNYYAHGHLPNNNVA